MFFERVVHAGRHRVEAERMVRWRQRRWGDEEGGRMSLFRALITTRQIEAVCVCVSVQGVC